MRVNFAGGAWIIGSSCGMLRSEPPEKLPEIDQLFPRIPARLGRFDDFTRLGFAVVGLALREAGWTPITQSDSTGLIVSTQYGVLQTDLDYYATTIEQDALLSSPNLFSYTLPVAIIGECAGFFNIKGPAFCIGDDGSSGMKALETALLMLHGGHAQRMIAAWIEAPPEFAQPKQAFAAAVVLGLGRDGMAQEEKTLQEILKRSAPSRGEHASSLFEIFPHWAARGPSLGESL